MGESGAKRGRAENDIVTVLLLVAAVALLIGVGYVWYRDSQMTGSVNPFKLSAPQNVSMVDTASTLG